MTLKTIRRIANQVSNFGDTLTEQSEPLIEDYYTALREIEELLEFLPDAEDSQDRKAILKDIERHKRNARKGKATLMTGLRRFLNRAESLPLP